MRDSERYRVRAEQAERLARDMTGPDDRQALLRIASEWRAMADKVAREEELDRED